MPWVCCVPGCGETGTRIFHSFPKNPLQCRKWIVATMCFTLDEHTAYSSHNNVCRKHFQKSDFRNWNLLHKGVVPTLNLPHIIFMEHNYCEKNSIQMHVPEISGLYNSSLISENSGALNIQEDSCVSENFMMKIVEECNKDDDVEKDDCVTEKDMITVLEGANGGVNVQEYDFGLANEMIVVEDNYSAKNLIQIHKAEKSELYNSSLISENNDAVNIQEADRVLKQSLINIVEVGNNDDNVQGNDCVLENNMMEVVEEDHSGGNSIDNQKHMIKSSTCSQKSNVESVNQIRQNSKPKSSRTYDPVARRMRYLSDRNKDLTNKLKGGQPKIPKSNKKSAVKKRIDETLKTLSSTLSPEQYNFIKLQIKNVGKLKQGYRFTFDEKTLALAIYKQNPKRYKDLAKRAKLPTRQTLVKHSAAIRFMEGVNPKLMNFVKETASQMEDKDKICTIGWDEMSLSAHLDFDQTKDYIDGFEDLGSKRTNNFATHALVFMVRGMNSKYKQPIAYFLTENIDSAELAELIRLVIGAVSDAGLKIIGSVCDAVSTNIAAVNKLINPKCLRGNTTGNLLEYTINGSNIVHYFDPPHLIKSVRNNLMVKDLTHFVSFNETKYKSTGEIVWNEKSKRQRWASWSDVKDFYEFNNSYSSGLFNLIPKITEEHMNPERRKMKVKLATQVFSGTYGRNLHFCSKRKQLPYDCTGTAAVLLFFNDIFDSVNGGDVVERDKLTGSLNAESKHFKFWDYAIRMLDAMTFTENLKTGTANKSNVLQHFITTLKGLREISERLFKLSFQSVSLRRGNQDGLENHFSVIRTLCGSNTKPNAREFRCAYSTSILINLLTDHSLNANCEADEDKPMLQNLRILFTQELKTDNGADNNSNASRKADKDHKDEPMLQNPQCFTQEPDNKDGNDDGAENMFYNIASNKDSSDVDKLDFPENEALNCISGQIFKKLLEKFKCLSCSSTTTANGKCIEHDIMRKQSSTVNRIILPNVEFIVSIKNLILKVKKILPVWCAEKNLMQKLLSGLAIENNFGCELHRNEFNNQLKKITLLVLIETFTRRVNNILSGKVTEASEDVIQKKALEFKNKKKHIGKYVPPNA